MRNLIGIVAFLSFISAALLVQSGIWIPVPVQIGLEMLLMLF